jgi:hypothetical protein
MNSPDSGVAPRAISRIFLRPIGSPMPAPARWPSPSPRLPETRHRSPEEIEREITGDVPPETSQQAA